MSNSSTRYTHQKGNVFTRIFLTNRQIQSSQSSEFRFLSLSEVRWPVLLTHFKTNFIQTRHKWNKNSTKQPCFVFSQSPQVCPNKSSIYRERCENIPALPAAASPAPACCVFFLSLVIVLTRATVNQFCAVSCLQTGIQAFVFSTRLTRSEQT